MKLLLLIFLLLPALCAAQIRTGADRLVAERLDLVRGKRVGLVTNQTGRLSTGTYLVDTLRTLGVAVTALFGPEHGIRGVAGPGETVNDSVDERTGIPVFSLYGAVSEPSPAMLRRVDVLVYDIQDVGARFYTYISTMALCMDAAARAGIPFIVLDRPNPLGGLLVDGPVLEDSLKSFVGLLPVPVVYGLTIGELARMTNGEGWLPSGKHADLTVVPVAGWQRAMTWRDTDLPWIAPSPNIPSPEAALAYPATCFIEATNLSEGRGTVAPFQLFGAPFVDASRLATALAELHLPGVAWGPAEFVPEASKQQGKTCYGVRMDVTAFSAYRPLTVAAWILRTLSLQCGDRLQVRAPALTRLAGTHDVGQAMCGRLSIDAVVSRWAQKTKEFERRSAPYRLYQ
ncbi:MAG TPA: DUF1343 domain-containing protein [Bacteroidota bacterium]